MGKKVEKGVESGERGQGRRGMCQQIPAHLKPVSELLIKSCLIGKVVADGELEILFKEFAEHIFPVLDNWSVKSFRVNGGVTQPLGARLCDPLIG
jgi:hypothetical protein